MPHQVSLTYYYTSEQADANAAIDEARGGKLPALRVQITTQPAPVHVTTKTQVTTQTQPNLSAAPTQPSA